MINFEADIVIKDGSLVHVRSFQSDDRQLLLKFVERLSEEAIYFRFFGSGISKESVVDALTNWGERGFGIIVLRDQKVVGHAGYYVSTPGTAEIGVIVSDEYRGKGLGTLLVGELTEIASENGIGTLEAIVVPENYRMIDMLRSLGFPVVQKIEPGSIRITYPTSLLPKALESFERREALATTAAINCLLCPKSVAVIGASSDLSTLGGQLFSNIIEGKFNGALYPVNEKLGTFLSLASYPSISDCPGTIDLAFVTFEAEDVIQVAKECAQKGIRSLAVISSGFAESGESGADLQNQLVRVCRESGMRLVGPNCMGIVNTDPLVSLNGQISSVKPSLGRIGFLSQSGALGIAVIDASNRLGLGMSSFVSIGNKADISGNDLIQYWEKDSNTDIILLYLESFGNPRKFSTITRRVSKKKPIIAVKSGRSPAGFRASQSHTGTMISSSDLTVDALFRQAGVIRTETLEEMFDVAALLSTQAIPKGNRVCMITNTGGAGILATDACESLGLEVSELSRETQSALRASLPRAASVVNPIDLTRVASPLDYRVGIRSVVKDPNVNALIIIFIPSTSADPQQVANEILEADRDLGHDLPFITVFMASGGITDLLSDGKIRVPSYPFPESAARALSHAVHYGTWVRKLVGRVANFDDARKSEAAALVARAMNDGARWLTPEEIALILDCYHIPTVRTMKITGVQAAQNDSIEMFVGITHDPTFGPVVACGAGGSYMELIKDLSVRLTPLTREDVDEMLMSLKTYPILSGYRGAAPADIRALSQIILRVGKLAEEIHEIAEMDLDPVMVYRNEGGAYVAEAKIRIARATPQTPLGAKR